MSSKFLIGLVSGAIFGIALGGIICQLALANHDEPCNKQDHYQKKSYDIYDPTKDSAMDFYWQDGQPSLHPR